MVFQINSSLGLRCCQVQWSSIGGIVKFFKTIFFTYELTMDLLKLQRQYRKGLCTLDPLSYTDGNICNYRKVFKTRKLSLVQYQCNFIRCADCITTATVKIQNWPGASHSSSMYERLCTPPLDTQKYSITTKISLVISLPKLYFTIIPNPRQPQICSVVL